MTVGHDENVASSTGQHLRGGGDTVRQFRTTAGIDAVEKADAGFAILASTRNQM
jgi:hypothetical protein